MSLYYQPSNKMPVSGVLICLLGSVVAAAVLALIYIYSIWYIPFLYINFFICLGFGIVLGAVLVLFINTGKLRSPLGTTILSVLVSLVAVYLEWAVYLTLLVNSITTGAGDDADTSTSFSFSVFVDILTQPAEMWDAIRRLNETGSWSLKGTTPTGILLWVVWASELLIIAGMAYFISRGQAREPFSESANEWADEETLAQPLSYAADAGRTRAALESGQFNSLTVFPPDSDDEQFARLKLYTAPNDPFCYYLTLENVTLTFDSKGTASEEADTVVQYLTISSVTYQELKRRFGLLPVAASPVEQASQDSTMPQ